MTKLQVGILGTGSAVPSRVVTNDDMAKIVETNDEWIRSRTGIRERRFVDADTATSDLSVEAARKAIEAAGITPEDIGVIIVATVTPDFMFPATACLVQERIGAKHAAAFDLSAGCSGFLYSLSCAVPMLESGLYKYALVIGAETLSKITNFSDRSTCVLFGDGAGAVVLGPTDAGRGFLSFEMGADGSGGELLKQAAGGSRNPATQESILAGEHYITMAGNEVFKFAVRILGSAAEAALAKAGLGKEDIDYLIPHQANVRIIDAAVNRLKLSSDKVYVNLDKYGNMSSASIPVALDEAVRLGKVQENDLLVLVGFGAGLTWGATALRW
ncbi:beta-ketoacyl-ACP synthase III [Tumebacillus flagellatus]|uniref:Beta-ketoacyl-[acyl-carrier-protein] synthase III n=1 Tax=Tumebacillus flagellatus TaxID=1157490 RepID=A0A074LLE6_9BACL|nr:beta-ketoacyl-ACP synthase III [Tumebacillus flagellatus]KEO81929.1 3-oxoacyl-ACP synthase [Tumebacillus flagellatus]